ncbi:MAG: hypothetical protein JWO11_4115 [Nocardioides sp.]|nr:hypothetical protein [Nocardioides sp.]
MSVQAGPYSYLRSCAGCTRSFATYAAKSWDAPFCCGPCQAKRMRGFNPQPNHTVHLVDRWSAQFVVLARVGDMLTIRRLGHPDGAMSAVHVANTMPTAGDAR